MDNNNMETKVCKSCGRELPIDQYRRIGNRQGAVNVLGICCDCMKARQHAGRVRAKAQREEDAKNETNELRRLRLRDFTPRELMNELASRGYEGTLTFTEVHTIDISKL